MGHVLQFFQVQVSGHVPFPRLEAHGPTRERHEASTSRDDTLVHGCGYTIVRSAMGSVCPRTWTGIRGLEITVFVGYRSRGRHTRCLVGLILRFYPEEGCDQIGKGAQPPGQNPQGALWLRSVHGERGNVVTVVGSGRVPDPEMS